MTWKLIECGLPAAKKPVLLIWPIHGMDPIVRIGSIMWPPLEGDAPIWKYDLDYGDAGAWVYSNRGDEQPTAWMEIPAYLP